VKVAICLSGHVRDYLKTYPFLIDEIIKPNLEHTIDVFISTWNVMDTATSHYARHKADYVGKPVDFNDIITKYQPKSLLVEQEQNFPLDLLMLKDRQKHEGIVFQGVYNMFYKIWNCNELVGQYCINNNFEYDIVIRYRFDFILKRQLIFNDLKIETNKVYTEYGWLKDDELSDKFAYGKPVPIRKYCNTYNNISQLLDNGTFFHPETLCRANLNNYNISNENVIDQVFFARYF
jgi:hypothetical protein